MQGRMEPGTSGLNECFPSPSRGVEAWRNGCALRITKKALPARRRHWQRMLPPPRHRALCHQHPHGPLQSLAPLASPHWEGPEEAIMPRLLALLTAQPSRAKGGFSSSCLLCEKGLTQHTGLLETSQSQERPVFRTGPWLTPNQGHGMVCLVRAYLCA